MAAEGPVIGLVVGPVLGMSERIEIVMRRGRRRSFSTEEKLRM